MVGLIVTGHGNFASGMISSAEWFIGMQDNLLTVDFPIQEAPEVFDDHLHAAVDSLAQCGSILVLCDLVGGIPFQFSARLAMERGNIEVIGGTNLGMLIDTVVARTEIKDVKELADRVFDTGHKQIAHFHYAKDE